MTGSTLLVQRERYAKGWFVVCFSEELEAGGVRPAKYFGRDLVLWRTEAGEPRVFDAHCPHLGAHLGHGGQVVGSSIRCPFHAWSFGADGKCSEVPYAKKIPPKAKMRAWPVLERNGLVMIWHDPVGGQPQDYVPVLQEFADEGWTPWMHRTAFIKTQPREVVENVADVAHFGPIHGNEVLSFEAKFEGPTATQSTHTSGHDRKGRLTKQHTVATYYGPAIQFSKMRGEYPTVLVNAHTPVDPNTLELRLGVLVKGIDTSTRTGRLLGDMWIDALQNGYFQDVAIWEHKRWRDDPMLCDGDGPIGKLREWYAQFYD